jgi:hypothetical protein
MRRLLTWLVVTLGVAALLRKLRRRREPAEAPLAIPTEDPADELRRRLAESRAEAEAEEAPAEPPTTEPPTTEATVTERRAEVHDRGQSTLEEMRNSDES